MTLKRTECKYLVPRSGLIEWKGYTSDEFPGLVVARGARVERAPLGGWDNDITTHEPANYWAIIHQSSGLTVLGNNLDTRRLAVDVAKRLASKPVHDTGEYDDKGLPVCEPIDWTKNSEAFTWSGEYAKLWPEVRKVLSDALDQAVMEALNRTV